MSRTRNSQNSSIISDISSWVGTDRIEIPDSVLSKAKLAILDTIGTTIGARRSQDFEVVNTLIERSADPINMPLIGRSGSASVADAALINSYTAHLLDFDDSHGDMAGHPTAVIFPAALALAHRKQRSFREVVSAYVVGVEVVSRLGLLLNPDHYDTGWHPTATIGVFGAAAAVARVLQLNVAQSEASLGLAAAFSGGLKASFGTSAKPLQVGKAAASGVQAGQLAGSGATARNNVFEHPQGYLRVFERKTAEASLRNFEYTDLGERWSLTDPGIIIKQYPCCGSTHSSIESAVSLSPIRAGDVDEVLIQLHPRRRGHVDRPHPETALESKFSVQYTVAKALLFGAVTVDDFTDYPLRNEEVAMLLEKTVVKDLEAPDTRIEDRYAASVTVRMKDGRLLEKHTPVASGRSPGEMLEASLIIDKFRNCVDPFLENRKIEAIIETVLGESDSSVHNLLENTRSDDMR